MLSQAEIEKVEAQIAIAEKQSAIEIVPMILQRSDGYPGARWRFAIFLAMLVSLGIFFYDPLIDPFLVMTVQFIVLFLAYWLAQIPWIHSLFLLKQKTAEEVHQRALQAFLENNLHATKDRTGILIMISLLEHRAEIVCDYGINQKVEQAEWERIIQELIAGIKQNKLADALAESIEACGKVVEEHFPIQADDENELKNHLIIAEE